MEKIGESSFIKNWIHPETLNEKSKSIGEYEKEISEEHITKRNKYLEEVCDRKYIDSHWDNLILTQKNEKQISKAREWVSKFSTREWLLINGAQGNAKTEIKNLIIKDLFDLKKTRVYSTTLYKIFMEYNDAVRNGNLNRYFNILARNQVLIIDEVGRRKITESLFDFLFALVDEFYLKRKSLILVSNLPFKKGEDGLGSYVDIDRMRELATTITFIEESYRGKK